jgi:hypothetical protein
MLLTVRSYELENTISSLNGPDRLYAISFLQRSRLQYRTGVDTPEYIYEALKAVTEGIHSYLRLIIDTFNCKKSWAVQQLC